MAQEDARNTNKSIANNEAEVILTCQGFPYQPREGIKQMLGIVNPHLVSLIQDKVMIQSALDSIHTNQSFT